MPTARELHLATRAGRASGQVGKLPGGIGFNGDLVQTLRGPVWVPHGTPPPPDAIGMPARADNPQGTGIQPQLDPNSNLYNYRNGARDMIAAGEGGPGHGGPPLPAEFDFPETWDPNAPQTAPVVGGYNGFPPQPSNPFAGGMGPQPPGAAPPPGQPTAGIPPSGPGSPGGPNNPFDPNMGPQPPGGPQLGLPNQPSQLQGLLAAYGYTQGPNGELLPIHLRQGMSPFQNQPGQSQVPGYTVPGWGESQGGEQLKSGGAQQTQGGDNGRVGHMAIIGYDAQGRPVDGSRLAREPGLQYTPVPNNPFDPSQPDPFPVDPSAPPYMGGVPPMYGGRRPGGG